MIATHRRLASIAVAACCAVSAGGALAAQASAATLAANQACYVNSGEVAQMTITGAGWVPGSALQLSGGTTSANTTADAAGNVSFTTKAPLLSTTAPGTKTTTLTATADNPDGSHTTATVRVTSANLAVATNPLSVRNVRKDKVTFSFSGFVPGKHIYGYYIRNKVVARTRFGEAQGPCGVLKQKALLFPGGRPSKDHYKVSFESSSRYDQNAFPRVTGMLKIVHF
jgi:hypothetical protein